MGQFGQDQRADLENYPNRSRKRLTQYLYLSYHIPTALIHSLSLGFPNIEGPPPLKQLKRLIASPLDADPIHGDPYSHALPAPALHAALCDLCRCTRRRDPAAASFVQRSRLLVSLQSRRYARVAGHA